MENPNRWAFTPLGRGKVVYEFPSGRVAVELENGDGHIFFREQVFVHHPEKRVIRNRYEREEELSNAG